MGCLPYFKFYPGDWLADTRDLTYAEKGAYIDLLAWSWKRGPLPLDPNRRARIIGASPRRFEAVWEGLASHWIENGKGFVNPRLERERDKAIRVSEAAKCAAIARWS